MDYKYAFGLLGNARGFLESAVNYVRRDDPNQWTFAILHLECALELLLKARLAVKNPTLLVAGKATVTDQAFARGDFRSVNIDECITRLRRVSQLTLRRPQQSALNALRSMRNRIVHYVDSTDISGVKAVVAACLNLFVELNNEEFKDEDPYRARTMLQIISDLHEFDEFVKARLDYLTPQLLSSPRPRTHDTDECSKCLQDATVIVDNDIQCLFCGDRMSIQDRAEWISCDGSIENCPQCGRRSVAKHQWGDRLPTHECFCCGYFRGQIIEWSDGEGSAIPRLKDLPPL